MSREKDFFGKVSDLTKKLKKLLENETWQKSFLLKRRHSELKKTLDNMESVHADLKVQLANVGKEDIIARRDAEHTVPDTHVVVYILLTLRQGGSLLQWQSAINALPQCYFGRPIYAQEEMAKKAITNKGSTANMGYVVVHVLKEKLIDTGEEQDTLGQALISLAPDAFTTDEIISFIHMNTQRFFWIQKKLMIDV